MSKIRHGCLTHLIKTNELIFLISKTHYFKLSANLSMESFFMKYSVLNTYQHLASHLFRVELMQRVAFLVLGTSCDLGLKATSDTKCYSLVTCVHSKSMCHPRLPRFIKESGLDYGVARANSTITVTMKSRIYKYLSFVVNSYDTYYRSCFHIYCMFKIFSSLSQLVEVTLNPWIECDKNSVILTRHWF